MEVPETLPRSIFRLFALFARPYRATVILMMAASISLRALSVLQIYAVKRIVDTAARTDVRAGGAWLGLARPLVGFFAILATSIVVEWAAWLCSYNSRIPVLARARQLVFTCHAELLARGGIYASLWSRQVGGFLVDDGGQVVATKFGA